LLYVRKFHVQHRRLNRVEPTVPAKFFVQVPLGTAVIAQAAHALAQTGVVGRDNACVTVGAQILARIEAERAIHPHSPLPPTLPALPPIDPTRRPFQDAPIACAASSTNAN